MENINHFNLRSFDLNLLIAFDAMMQEMSVTKAAEKLRIGQSAMSHNLSTLRLLLQDDLFIRVGQTMQPTARALALGGPVRAALHQAQSALDARDVFCPHSEIRLFRVGLTGEMEMVLLPALMARIQRLAPGVKLLSRTVTADTVDTMMDSGAIDLAVGCKEVLQSRYCGEILFESQVACCFNPTLLPFDGGLGRKEYLAARHAVLSQTDNVTGCVGAALQGLGIEIDIVMAAPDFMPLLAAARTAPLIATVPGRIASQYAALFGLAVCDMPIEIHFPPVSMNWPLRTDKDAGGMWLRDQVRAVVQELNPSESPAVIAAE
ncbi:LysR substrate-binding domain-containing protein [Thalassospira sp.]|uniref:LysR substrate-binding domain-containing protein n=1 Tax=Thalassospira sp. TaxID=1912094 RepID=UPI00273333F8|nr:LysR substrate-binding domain-containing protein [Thalassospira sp.]MDP2698927.1 LysR family transcriptional regulator [Thalassospira sp.]